MSEIAGIFGTRAQASHAVEELLHSGFAEKEISVMMSDKARDLVFTDTTTTQKGAHDAAEGGLAGAITGGVFGALLASLAAAGNLVIPGMSLMITGPIVAALAGAGAGGTLGALSGALVAAGFSEDEAAKYETEIKAGKAVIIVHPGDKEEEDKARSILYLTGAEETKAA